MGNAAETDDGSAPVPRSSVANERPCLAGRRAGLAVVVAGLGVVQLLPPFPGVPWGRHVLGVPLIVFGAVVAVVADGEWVRSQRALRHRPPLPPAGMPWLLAPGLPPIPGLAAPRRPGPGPPVPEAQA